MKTLREKQLAAVWRTTHRDFKGVSHGVKTIMIHMSHRKNHDGKAIIPLSDLLDSEIPDYLPKDFKP